jgi:predicted nucleic acid-binding protein
VFERFTRGRSFTPRLWTDVYLAAYAQASGLVLVSFDQGFRQFDGLTCQVIESEQLP